METPSAQMDGYALEITGRRKPYSLAVHLDFRDRVFKALQTRQKKGLGIDWDLWGNVLGINIEHV